MATPVFIRTPADKYRDWSGWPDEPASFYACAIACSNPLSNDVQKTIISSEHRGQGRSSTAPALWSEINDPHFSQCQRVPLNRGR